MKQTPPSERIKAENPDAVRSAIALLEMVKEKGMGFKMSSWQDTNYDDDEEENANQGIAEDIDQAHKCGSACCMAGWVALSEDFQNAGGRPMPLSGAPVIDGHTKHNAIARYFGIPSDHAALLTAYTESHKFEKLYGVGFHSEITVDMVIEKLQELL